MPATYRIASHLRLLGRAEAVVQILNVRSIDVPSDTRETILCCKDAALLDAWIECAISATTVNDLFDNNHPALRKVLQYREEGRNQGRAEAIVLALEKRGVAVPGDERKRILACRDRSTLNVWFDRAITATTIDEVFNDNEE